MAERKQRIDDWANRFMANNPVGKALSNFQPANVPIIGSRIIRPLQQAGTAATSGNWGDAGRDFARGTTGMLTGAAVGAAPIVGGFRALAGGQGVKQALKTAVSGGSSAPAVGRIVGQRTGPLGQAVYGGAVLGVGPGVLGRSSSVAPTPQPASTSASDPRGFWERNLQTPQDQYQQRQQDGQARAQQMQDQMVQNINASFSPEQSASLQDMAAGYTTPDWITAMAGLSPTQSWEFERAGSEADDAFSRFQEQAEFERERGQAATTSRVRGARQAAAGGAQDLQAALARRGLGTSLATAGVGSDFISQVGARETAAARGAFSDLESRLQREEAQAGARRESFLSDLGRQRQAQMQENESASQAAAAQHREWWMSQGR